MTFRLCNIPLNEANFEKEKLRIYEIAEKNGYTSIAIDSLIKKHQKRLATKNITSLQPLNDDAKRISMHFHGPLHSKLSNCFSRANISLAARSTTKIKQLLKSTKDAIPYTEKPGVYMAKCEQCEVVYIGQTRRELKIRANEHIRCIKNNMPHNSAIAEHSIQTKHPFTHEHFTLLEHESNRNKLNILESMHIHLNRHNNINRDDGPHASPLFKLLS